MTARDKTTAVLLLSCQDQKGLVAATSDFIYRNNGNIAHADQHVDVEAGLFLQRVEWELADFRIPRAEVADAFRPIAERFGMQWELHFSDYVPRMAILVSKLEHCLYDLLLRQRMREFEAEIPLVISNHADLQQFVEAFGPQYHFYPITKETKAAQEKKQIELLEEERIDLVVLARYMQILGGEFVRRFRNRIINIHHSFLPAFPGGRPYHQAYERGVKIIGATSHYASEELDQGPIIEQDVVRVSHRDSVQDLIRKGKDLEKVVLARAVSLHLAHRILVYGNKTVVFD
ncbi:MAG: formyltetrahydrofolate deformylase [Dehalococcoidia bacterium SM23_28_1]|nr:MAG: formyltetrahydrofolate deformylase [Dehalococcoidia bacterium SM23_28_1]